MNTFISFCGLFGFIVIGWFFITVVGLPFLPFWLIFGFYFCKKYFDRIECNLTEQTLELKKGHIFRIEKIIPLDKIQDLTLREGPLLRALNICMLDIETAGQSNPQGSSDAKIIGIIEARKFRDLVLAQRDLIITKGSQQTVISKLSDSESSETSLLTEIRNSLQRIEKLLDK